MVNKMAFKGYEDYVTPPKRKPYKNKKQYDDEYAEHVVENMIGEYEDDD